MAGKGARVADTPALPPVLEPSSAAAAAAASSPPTGLPASSILRPSPGVSPTADAGSAGRMRGPAAAIAPAGAETLVAGRAGGGGIIGGASAAGVGGGGAALRERYAEGVAAGSVAAPGASAASGGGVSGSGGQGVADSKERVSATGLAPPAADIDSAGSAVSPGAGGLTSRGGGGSLAPAAEESPAPRAQQQPLSANGELGPAGGGLSSAGVGGAGGFGRIADVGSASGLGSAGVGGAGVDVGRSDDVLDSFASPVKESVAAETGALKGVVCACLRAWKHAAGVLCMHVRARVRRQQMHTACTRAQTLCLLCMLEQLQTASHSMARLPPLCCLRTQACWAVWLADRLHVEASQKRFRLRWRQPAAAAALRAAAA